MHYKKILLKKGNFETEKGTKKLKYIILPTLKNVNDGFVMLQQICFSKNDSQIVEELG